MDIPVPDDAFRVEANAIGDAAYYRLSLAGESLLEIFGETD
jgi:hypothetical protein